MTLFLYGLSAAIMSQVYHRLFKPKVVDFVLFLAILSPSVVLFCTVFLHTFQKTQDQSDEEKKLIEKQNQVDKTGWKLLLTTNYWILFIIFSVCNGSGINFTTINQ